MQDKEFDELFSSRFESAEIQPSANLWSKIDEKLDTKPKRVFPVYWAAAAAILVAVTAGVLFHQTGKIPTDQIQLATGTAITPPQEKADGGIGALEPVKADNQVAVGTAPLSAINATALPQQAKDQYAVTSAEYTTSPGSTTAMQTSIPEAAVQTGEQKDLLAMQPSVKITHLEYKEVSVKAAAVKLPKAVVVQPVQEVMLATADVAADETTANGSDEAASENRHAESKGIRNVGDLVNYVVDKVDKRDEKFIQFKTDDDDNSSLIGLNIGMFKFNQKKHK